MSLLGDFSNIDNTLTGDTNLQSLTVSDLTCDYINGLDGSKLANLSNSTSDLQTQIDVIVAGSNVPVISVGTTSTLPAGSSATVVQSGAVETPIFSFGIPQGVAGTNGANGANGDKGDTGDKGDKGDTGDKGDAGTDGGGAAAGAAAGAISGAAAGTTSGAAAGTTSGAAAGTTSGAAAGAEAATTAYESRVLTLENKTDGMYSYTDVNGKIHTDFKDKLTVLDSTGFEKIKLDGNNKTIILGNDTIKLDGNNQKITLGSTQELNGVQIISPSLLVNNIDARTSVENLNIGTNNGILTTINIGNPSSLINFMGATNFGFNMLTGIISQF